MRKNIYYVRIFKYTQSVYSRKNIKVYPLSKYCDFDRATMYKIINGKRNPPSRDIIEKMSDFMRLTPTEDEQFKEAYEISRIGADNYYRRKSTENFLMHFPDKFSIHTGSASDSDFKMNPGRLPVPQFRHR